MKKKVAAYARVSTDKDEQYSSYASQIDYYTNYIKAHDDYEFVKVYTDEGISGTSIKKRIGFKQMINDAVNGKIDLIITKSVSRFARNTVDSLVTIRKLKEKNVEVFFEKENIYTLDVKGELLLTIMSCLAQEESRSISQNVTWGMRKWLKDGNYKVPFKSFLGYDRSSDGKLIINKEQALIVKRIYQDFLNGMSCYDIATSLTQENVKTPMGKDNWHYSVIRSILKNEKYMGDALTQKTYVSDFLTKNKKKNDGSVPSYYLSNVHEPIISKDDWYHVQYLLSNHESYLIPKYKYALKLKCPYCNCYYGKKIWHPYSTNPTVIYRCNNKYRKLKHQKKIKCLSPNLKISEIEVILKQVYNLLINNKDLLNESFKNHNEQYKIIKDNVNNNLNNNYNEIRKSKDELFKLEDLIKADALIKELINNNYNEDKLLKIIKYIYVKSIKEIECLLINGELIK